MINNTCDLMASIRAILNNNNCNELSFGDPEELYAPTYVIWYDNQGNPYDDPIIKVTLQNTELSFKVDARDFGNTITIYEDDINRREWWQGIRDNILEVIQRDGHPRCPVCGKPLKTRQEYCSDACQKGTSIKKFKS